MRGFNPGDVEIQKCMLSGQGGSVDISRRVQTLSVFENILKPYTGIQVHIKDVTDILNHNVGLDGNNTLEVSFSQPGQEPYTGTFSVTTAEKGKSAGNLRVATYDLVGYSKHMTKHPKVQKAYRDKTATSIAQDLINTFLSPDKPLKIGDPSRGMLGNLHMPYNVNGVQIHKAIRSVLARAASSKNTSSLYTYFEDNKNLVIDTLDNLLEQALANPVATYYQRPMGQDFMRDMVLQNFIILAMKEHNRVDLTAQVQTKNTRAQPFDLFSTLTKPKDHGERDKISSYLNLVYDSLRPPTHMAQVMPDRSKRAGEFDSQALTIHVPLNTALTVGKGFKVETIAPAGDTNTAVPDKVSGPLLAMEVRHTINLTQDKMMGTSTVRGTKGGKQQ